MGFFKKEPKILVIDDDKDLTDNLVEYLTKLDYQAFPAYGGREGLTKLQRFRGLIFVFVVSAPLWLILGIMLANKF